MILNNLDEEQRFRIKYVKGKIWEFIRCLNLFGNQRFGAPQLDRQRFTTRIFVFLMIGLTVLIGFYICISEHILTIKVNHPSLTTYEELNTRFHDSLICPCSEFSIPYGNFLNITYNLHQICSSDLVSKEWLEFTSLIDMNHITNELRTALMRDFRSWGMRYFQLLASYCITIKQRIDTTIIRFLQTRWIINRMIQRSTFLEHINEAHQTFVNSLIQDFARTQQWLIMAVHVNQFLAVEDSDSYSTVEENNEIIIF